MKKSKIKFYSLAVIILALLLGGFALAREKRAAGVSFKELKFSEQKGEGQKQVGAVGAAAEAKTVETVPDLTKEYKNTAYKFSFKYPEGYSIGSTPGDDGTGAVIVVQNAQEGVGFQIAITPFDDADTTITKERIRADIPDMEVSDEQEVLIGEGGKGLAFVGKNSLFGTSREVWFVFRGNLYQISTYLSQDKLLQAVFTTWKFY